MAFPPDSKIMADLLANKFCLDRGDDVYPGQARGCR